MHIRLTVIQNLIPERHKTPIRPRRTHFVFISRRTEGRTCAEHCRRSLNFTAERMMRHLM